MYGFIKHRMLDHIQLGCERKHCFRCWLGNRMVIAGLKGSLRRTERRIVKLKHMETYGVFVWLSLQWHAVCPLTPKQRREVRAARREQEEIASTFRRALDFSPRA